MTHSNPKMGEGGTEIREEMRRENGGGERKGGDKGKERG